MSDEHADPSRLQARQSYTGCRMTESQFDEAWNITGIINREIHKSGSFIEKITDYAHAFARSQKFDAARGEVMIRDLYSARFGESMNETRENLMGREAFAKEAAKEHALKHAHSIGSMIKDGATMPFYQALDRAGLNMARRLDITETGAKRMMADAFEQAEGKPFREHFKDIEAEHHIPVRDAERAARQQERRQLQRTGPQM